MSASARRAGRALTPVAIGIRAAPPWPTPTLGRDRCAALAIASRGPSGVAGVPATHAARTRAALATGLAVLAAMGVASFLVLRGLGSDLGVVALAIVQAAFAAAFLAPWRRHAVGRLAFRRHACPLAGLSLLSGTLPALLSTLAAPHVGAGAMAVAHAHLPLTVALVGAVWLGERNGGLPFVGFVAGLGGMALLWWDGLVGRPAPDLAAAGTGVLLAPTALALGVVALVTLCGALGTHVVRSRWSVTDTAAMVIVAQGGSALTLLLPAAWLWPGIVHDAAAWGRVAALGAAAAGLGFVLGRSLARRAARTA